MAQTHTVILVVDRLVIGADADVERSALCCLWHDGGPLSKSSPTVAQDDIRIQELGQIAERRGWTVVATYRDAGISGAKGRDSARALTRCSRMPAGAISTS